MSQKVFVPITDEILYDHPELITAPLLPFNAGQPCFHWMADRRTDGRDNETTGGMPGADIDLSAPEKSAA